MKITPAVLRAIQEGVRQAGNPSKFAKMIPGLRQTTVRNWLLGITKSISDENWRNISIFLDISATDMEMMHSDLDKIGPDPDLKLLLGLWKNMDEDLRNRFKKLIDETVARDVIPDIFDFCGLNRLPEKERASFLEKYGGLQKLTLLCSSGAIDENKIYQEIETLLKKYPEVTAKGDKHSAADSDREGAKK